MRFRLHLLSILCRVQVLQAVLPNPAWAVLLGSSQKSLLCIEAKLQHWRCCALDVHVVLCPGVPAAVLLPL